MTAALAEHLLEHGEDVASREQAAAHEIGHVLVDHALGRAFGSTRVTRTTVGHRRVWLGYTKPLPHPDDIRGVELAREPGTALAIAARQIAGFAGESVAGLDHESSSLDERTYAMDICCSVAHAVANGRDADKLTNALGTLIWDVAIEVISENRTAFDVLRAMLGRQRRINRLAALPILARAKIIAPPWGNLDWRAKP